MRKIKISKKDHPKICELYKSGMTYQQIADKFSVSRQMVGKICKDLGLNASLGGSCLQKKKREEVEKQKKDRIAMERYGCSHDEALKMFRTFPKNPLTAYTSQMKNAESRGILWEFNFCDWWKVWHKSGKWLERGTGSKRYCMARINDTGPYRADNVEIVTNRQNIQMARELEGKKKNKEVKV